MRGAGDQAVKAGARCVVGIDVKRVLVSRGKRERPDLLLVECVRARKPVAGANIGAIGVVDFRHGRPDG